MRFKSIDPPRVFEIGRGEVIQIKDCARIELGPDEQVTFVTETEGEYDVTRKSWGFYATPSLNGRLLDFGLRAVLMRSFAGKYYVLLVERGKEEDFRRYLESERGVVIRWLDNDEDLAGFGGTHAAVGDQASTETLCICGSHRFVMLHVYFDRPLGELRFARNAETQYRRELLRCTVCGHFVSRHLMGDVVRYDGVYVDSTYGDENGIQSAFDEIASLPSESSDNQERVRRILEFAGRRFAEDGGRRSVLDVGSGICVFLHEMKRAGWGCTALDPDPRAIHQARDVVGVDAVCSDFATASDLGRFDLVTFNKVLEHVADPIPMLARARQFLKDDGFVYVEVPDGEAASVEGFERQEFFIQHLHVFSLASASLLITKAGFTACSIERLREPSGKCTLRAFLIPS